MRLSIGTERFQQLDSEFKIKISEHRKLENELRIIEDESENEEQEEVEMIADNFHEDGEGEN